VRRTFCTLNTSLIWFLQEMISLRYNYHMHISVLAKCNVCQFSVFMHAVYKHFICIVWVSSDKLMYIFKLKKKNLIQPYTVFQNFSPKCSYDQRNCALFLGEQLSMKAIKSFTPINTIYWDTIKPCTYWCSSFLGMILNCMVYYFYFHIHTVRLDIIRVFYSPTNAQVIGLKTILQ